MINIASDQYAYDFDSDISLAVSTRMPYCSIFTFEDNSTYKLAKDKSNCIRAIEYNGYM